jgi:adenylate cyclase
MQKTTLFVLLVLSCTYLKAQTNLDSLYNVWQDKTETDSLRTHAYKTYIWDGYLSKKPDSAFILAENLVSFSKTKQYPRAMAEAYVLKARSFRNRKNYPKTLEYLNSSLKLRKEIGDKKGIADSYTKLGIVYHKMSNFDKSIFNFLEALKIKEQLGDEIKIAHNLYWIGKIHAIAPDSEVGLPLAMQYFDRALKIFEKFDDKKWIVASQNCIGMIYLKQGNGQPIIKEKIIKALEVFQKVLPLAEKLESRETEAQILGNIGPTLQILGNYKQSLTYLFRSLELHIDNKNFISAAHKCNDISETYDAMNDLDNAEKYALKAIELANGVSLNQERYAFYLLSEIYKSKDEYKTAIVYLDKYHNLADSIFSLEKIKSINENQLKYETEKKSLMIKAQESDIAFLNEKSKLQSLQRNGLMAGFGVVLLFAVVAFRQRNRIGKEKERSEKLLLNILPKEVAEELKNTGKASSKKYENVSILFTDFIGFTKLVASIPATTLIEELNHIFGRFDDIMDEFEIEKIETIGDAYMAACGLPEENVNHAQRCVQAAQKMVAFLNERNLTNDIQWKMRVGIHSGPVVAGVVGKKKFAYDLFGDSVNTAARMESNGEPEKINISQSTYDLLKDEPSLFFKSRGKILAKGKGQMEMYFVETKLKYQ